MTPQDLVGLALVYAIIASSLAVALVMERRGTGGDARKVVHVGVGLFVLVWWMFSENWIMLVFFTVPFAVLLFIAMFRGNAVSESKLGDLANNKGHRTGLFLYAGNGPGTLLGLGQKGRLPGLHLDRAVREKQPAQVFTFVAERRPAEKKLHEVPLSLV